MFVSKSSFRFTMSELFSKHVFNDSHVNVFFTNWLTPKILHVRVESPWISIVRRTRKFNLNFWFQTNPIKQNLLSKICHTVANNNFPTFIHYIFLAINLRYDLFSSSQIRRSQPIHNHKSLLHTNRKGKLV